MSKGNCIYNVFVYVGDMSSHNAKCVYTTSKQSEADKYLHDYIKKHPEVQKAYIERSYGRQNIRYAKYMREDEE